MAGSSSTSPLLSPASSAKPTRSRKPEIPWEPYKACAGAPIVVNPVDSTPQKPKKLVRYALSADIPENCRLDPPVEVEKEFDLQIVEESRRQARNAKVSARS